MPLPPPVMEPLQGTHRGALRHSLAAWCVLGPLASAAVQALRPLDAEGWQRLAGAALDLGRVMAGPLAVLNRLDGAEPAALALILAGGLVVMTGWLALVCRHPDGRFGLWGMAALWCALGAQTALLGRAI